MRSPSFSMLLAAAALFAASFALSAEASGYKDKGYGHPGRGWGVGHVPPGHQKKYYKRHYSRGDRLPDDYIIIVEPTRWGLRPLPRDEVYVRVDNQILRAMRDTATVIEAIGIVSRALD